VPAYQATIAAMREQLFTELAASGGLEMPLRPPKGVQFYDRKLP
jgi:N-acetylglucosamine-6-sulfatase